MANTKKLIRIIIIVPVIPMLYPNNWLKSKYWLNKKLPIKIKNPSEKSDFKFINIKIKNMF